MSQVRMGFSLTDLVFFPVTVPIKGFLFVMERLREIVDDELYNEQKLYKNLMELELQIEMGDITEAEYERRHTVLMERLRYVQSIRRAEQQAAAENPASLPTGGKHL